MIRKKNDTPKGMKWCSRHRESLPEELFTKGQTMCKQCRKDYRSKDVKQALKVLCYNALERVRRTTGKYVNVTCPYTTTNDFFKAIWTNEHLQKMYFDKWKAYAESGYDPMYKPSMDRIHKDGHYTLSNIQFLSQADHRIKDGHKLMLDLFYQKEGINYVKRMTREQAKAEFPALLDIMQGGFGDGILLQNASTTVNPALLNCNRPHPTAEEIQRKLEESRIIVDAVKKWRE